GPRKPYDRTVLRRGWSTVRARSRRIEGRIEGRLVEAPGAASGGPVDAVLEPGEEFGQLDLAGAEALEVLGVDLAVDEGESPRAQLLHQRRERELGGVGAVGEHALAEEHRAERHAVEAADHGVALPGLDRVR